MSAVSSQQSPQPAAEQHPTLDAVVAEIWTDRAGFEAKAADYAAAATQLQAAAQANDSAAFTAAWTTVRQTCQACHDAYRM